MKNFTLVTGSSRGIGAGISEHLMSKRTVFTNSRGLSKSTFLYSNNTHRHLFFDCANQQEVHNSFSQLVQQGYSMNELVCCVGSGSIIVKSGDSTWLEYWRTNFLSAQVVIEEALNLFGETLRHIVVMSSIAGLTPMTDPPVEYSVSKAALNHYIKVLAKGIAPNGILLNAILPGNILFPGSRWQERLDADESQTKKYIHDNVPLMKFGSIASISLLVEFLLEKNDFITGQLLTIDGGQSL